MMKKSITIDDPHKTDGAEVLSIVSFVFAVIFAVIGCIAIPVNGYDAFLAYTNPEMFTIQQVIEQVKK